MIMIRAAFYIADKHVVDILRGKRVLRSKNTLPIKQHHKTLLVNILSPILAARLVL